MPEHRPIRLMVVDDHEVVRRGLVSLLRREQAMVPVACVSSGEEALAILEHARPDVVLLDHRLPGMSGTETCHHIVARRPQTSVIMLTAFAAGDVVHASLAAGARGFLTKDVSGLDLTAAVQAVARGGTVLAPEITKRVVSWTTVRGTSQRGTVSLAPEEIRVLDMVAQGSSNRAIATTLCVSPGTVKRRLGTAMRKLGARRREDAVAAGIEQGVI